MRVEEFALAEVLIDYIKEHQNCELIQTTYEEISEKLWKTKNIRIEPKRLGQYLGPVSEYFHEKGFPFISAIVVSKKEPHIPGTGFYILLQGYGISDEVLQYKEIQKAQTFKDYQKLYNCLYNKEEK